MKRKKAMLCALASIGFMTSVSTVKANAMTMNTNNTKTTLKAYQVEQLMYNLPYTMNLNLRDQIENTIDVIQARVAYNSLSDQKKHCVDPDAVSNLEHAESNIRRVYGDEIKAIVMGYTMDQLKKEVGYNDGKIGITKDELKCKNESIYKKINYIEDTYKKLDYSISSKVFNLISDVSKIECQLSILN